MRQVRSSKTERIVRALLACSDADCENCPFRKRKNTPRGCFPALARETVAELQRLEGRMFQAMEEQSAQKPPKPPLVSEELLACLRAGCSVVPLGSLKFRPDKRFPRINLPGSKKTYVIFPASPGETEKEGINDET